MRKAVQSITAAQAAPFPGGSPETAVTDVRLPGKRLLLSSSQA